MQSSDLIFILAPARSGSTLLQRLIATDPSVGTASEPWLMLPLTAVSHESENIRSPYEAVQLNKARSSLSELLQTSGSSLNGVVSNAALDVYQTLAMGRSRFLDKTPRYLLIVRELMELFPDAKFVSMWRNPLDIVRSIIVTWCNGAWKFDNFYVDLYDCVRSMIELDEVGNILTVNYEDLVSYPDRICSELEAFLHLKLDYSMLKESTTQLQGTMGDQVLSDSWKSRLLSDEVLRSSTVRRRWCQNYIKWIGEDALLAHNYDVAVMHERITSNSQRTLPSDLVNMSIGALKRWFEPTHIRRVRERHVDHLPAIRVR